MLRILISIHVPLARDDAGSRTRHGSRWHFNPRPSCEGRHGADLPFSVGDHISIHVPLARDDASPREDSRPGEGFQSTSLLRGTTSISSRLSAATKFQSTSLLRGTTSIVCVMAFKSRFQSTSLLRGTTCFAQAFAPVVHISIHVPLARDDLTRRQWGKRLLVFQSTSLLRGTTAEIT